MDKSRNDRLKKTREYLEQTQSVFAKYIGVSSSYISDIENYRRSVTDKFIKKVSVAFGINEIWLYTGSGDILAKVDYENEVKSVPISVPINTSFVVAASIKQGRELMRNNPEIQKERNIQEKYHRLYIKNNPEYGKLLDYFSEFEDFEDWFFSDLRDSFASLINSYSNPPKPFTQLKYSEYEDLLNKESQRFIKEIDIFRRISIKLKEAALLIEKLNNNILNLDKEEVERVLK